MSIITPANFNAENAIGQREQAPVASLIQSFIDKYEPIFLKKLLGLKLYNDLVAGLAVEPVDPKWTFIVDDTELKPMLVDYVYYWYMGNDKTVTVGSGQAKSKLENAHLASNEDKRVRAWNEMVGYARLFTLSTVDYPDYVKPRWHKYHCWFHGCPIDEIYYFKNTLNL